MYKYIILMLNFVGLNFTSLTRVTILAINFSIINWDNFWNICHDEEPNNAVDLAT
mgnify:CR=1 FL=1